MTLGRRALGVAAGLLLDRALGEPPDAWHPVAWFGTAMGAVERAGYADTRAAGVRHAVVGAGLGAAAGLALRGATAGRWSADVAAAVAVASAGRMLRHTARDIEDLLLADDLDGARERLPWLVGRDPAGLDASGVAAAVVESLAENTVDAVVAPAFWGLVAGAPGVLVHRAVNTMDAMVGHRSPRYRRFGWAAARLDDAMASVPARVMAGVVALLTAAAGDDRPAAGTGFATGGARGAPPGGADRRHAGAVGRARTVLRVVRRDAPAHPSPNAGVAESAVAAALGVQLGGPLRYGERLEDRPRLGDGPRPDAVTIARARVLVDRVELVVVAGALGLWAVEALGRDRSGA